MDEEKQNRPSDADQELARQIRAERKFSLTEAIGRMAGPGAMKGVSPVDRKHQAVAEIQEYIDRHLKDAGGVLSGVLLRFVRESEVLLKGYEQPLVALGDYLRRVLNSEYAIKELCREADVAWGQLFGERPHFEKEGCPPDPDDPYTHESVRTALTQLAETLAASEPNCPTR